MPRATVSLACLLWLTLVGVVPAQSDVTSDTGVVSLQNYSGGVSYGGTYFQVQNVTGNGVGWTNGYTQLGALTPYWLNEDTVFAANGRMIITDNQQIGGNLGGFARHYSSGMDRIFGANAYYDIDQSINDFSYRQTGIGVETLGQWWDFRANGYFPVTSGDNFVRPLALTNNLLYSGHQIAFAGTGLYEQALTGGDFEFGRPIFASTPWLRAYAGMYLYNSRGEDPVGFRGRVESWISDDLSVGVMVTEDRQFNTNVNAVVNFLFSGWKPTRWFPNYTTRERMLMPVQRNWRIAAGTYEQILKIAAINPRTNQPYFVDWVDNSSTTAGPGDGTYENPFKTLQPNFPDADLILVNRGNTTPVAPLTGSVALTDFQRLLGEGSVHQFETYANFGRLSIPRQTFNLPGFTNSGNIPYVSGGAGNFVTLANNNEVSSFNILNSAGAGITNTPAGSNNFDLNRLNLTNNAGGGILLTQATSAGFITNVNATNNLAGGISVDSGAIPLTLAMNGVTSNGQAPGAQAFGIRLLADNSAMYAALNNVTTTGNAGNGIDLTETNVGMQAVLTNVTSTGNGGDGLRADAVGNGLALSLNTVNTSGNADHGIYVSGSAAYISFTYANLDDSFNGNDNLRFNLYNGSTLVGGGLTNTHFDSSAAGSGIVFYTDTGSQVGSPTNFFSLRNVTANGNNQSGMQMTANSASQQFISVVDGFFNNNGLDGTTITENGGAGVVLNVDPTSMTGNGRDGLHFDVTGGSFLIGSFDRTEFSNNQNAGIYGNADSALVNLTLTASNLQNTVPFAAGAQDYGMQLNLTNLTQFAATITDSNITNNLQQGILATVSGASPNINSLTLTNALVNGNGSDGLKANLQSGANLVVTANASQFARNGLDGAGTGDGLDFTVDGVGTTAIVNLNNTIVSSNNHDGVLANVTGGGALGLTTTAGTRIDDNASNGVEVTANASTFVGSFTGTSVSHNLAGSGVNFTGTGAATSAITFTNSFIYHNQLDNFFFDVSAGHDLDLDATGTTFSLSTAGRGINGHMTGAGTDVLIDQFLNVTSNNNRLDGMRLRVDGLATLNGNINGGSFSGNGFASSDGVNVAVTTGGQALICFDGTQANANSDDGYDFSVVDPGSALYVALQTSGDFGTLSASYNADQPVAFSIAPGASGGLFMDGNNQFINNHSATGITFSAIGSAGTHIGQAIFSFSGTSNGNSADGINVQMSFVDDAYIDIHDGAANNNGGSGIDIALDTVVFGASPVVANFLQGALVAQPFNISDMTLDGNGDEGIKIVGTGVTMAIGTIDGNTVTGNGLNGTFDGVLFDLDNSSINTLNFTGNTITSSTENGVNFDFTNVPITTLNISGNLIGLSDAANFLPSDDSLPVIRSGFNSFTLPPNDDGSTGLVSLGFDINFYGQIFSQLYVNNNGNVTFDDPLGDFTPFPIVTNGIPMMAPFFADVDTTSAGQPVKYGTGTVNGHQAFGVDWLDVDYFNSSTTHTLRNSFQLVIIDRSDIKAGDFDFEFNYGQIQWETGDASGGTNGLGGSSARVGFTNGSSQALEFAGSAVNGALLDSGPSSTSLIQNSLNSTHDGRYIFSARNGSIGNVAPNAGDGIHISQVNSNITNLVVDQNDVENNGGRGFNLIAANSTITNATISANTFSSNGSDGVTLDLTNVPVTTLTLTGNAISSNAGEGIALGTNANITTLNITSNQILTNDRNGVYLNLDTSTVSTLNITGNTITGPGSNFNIDVEFGSGLTASQQAIFADAAARWAQIITGDLPDVGSIDDLQILASGVAIDGVGGILGQAAPDGLRAGSFLPYSGFMQFDTADLASLESSGQLEDVILHEMGHVLGFGTIWTDLGLLTGAGGSDPQFTGSNAVAKYDALFPANTDTGVPVENTGGPGTADAHWRETVFGDELMTGILSGTTHPISDVTVGQFQDLGYQVNYSAADPFLSSGSSLKSTGGSSTPATPLHLQVVNTANFVVTDPKQVAVATPYALASLVTPASSIGDGIHIEMTDSQINNVNLINNNINSNVSNGVNFAVVDNSNIGPVVATGNIINQNGADGFRLVDPDTANNSLNLAFTGNTMNSNGGNGINLQISNGEALTLTMPSGNTIGATGAGNLGMGVRLDVSGTSTFNATIGTTGQAANNFGSNRDAGVGITMSDTAQGQLTVVNSNFTNNVNGADANFSGQGLGIGLIDGATLTNLTIGDTTANNTNFTGNAADGIGLSVDSSAVVNNVVIRHVSATGNGNDGMNFFRQGNAQIANTAVSNSVFNGNRGNGVELTAAGRDLPADTYTFTDTTFNTNTGNGMRLNVIADGDLDVLVTRGTFTSNGASGIEATRNADTTDTPMITLEVQDSTITQNTGDGIRMYNVREGGNPFSDYDLTVNNTLISLNTRDGINLRDPGVSLITNNRILRNGDDGIDIRVDAGGGATSEIYGNTIQFNGNDGVQLVVQGDGAVGNFTVGSTAPGQANQILDNGGRGIMLITAGGNSNTTTTTTANFNGNTIARNQLEGVYVVNTAANAQADEANVDNVTSDEMLTTDQLLNRPRTFLTINSNTINANGKSLDAGDFIGATGIVVRVGSSNATNTFTDNGGTFNGGVRGGVGATITGNTLHGNYGADVTFAPFISTAPPAQTQGTWSATEFTVDSFTSDPLARLDLVFNTNTGDGLFATNTSGAADVANVFYNNDEGTFKSRTTDATDPGPFSDGDRARNATRLGSRSAPNFDDPTTPGGASNTFNYSGVGGSTFRVNLTGGNTFVTGGGSFGGSIPIGGAFGEEPFLWGTLP